MWLRFVSFASLFPFHFLKKHNNPSTSTHWTYSVQLFYICVYIFCVAFMYNCVYQSSCLCRSNVISWCDKIIGVLKLALMQSRPQTTICVPFTRDSINRQRYRVKNCLYNSIPNSTANWYLLLYTVQCAPVNCEHPKRENPSWEKNPENQ